MIITTTLDQAVRTLRQGGLVAFPTETVYGLGADATNAQAVANIFAVKNRPLQHPLIVHISALKQMEDWAGALPDYALKLAQHFWPGPLTLVLPKQAHVLDSITAGQSTIGLRMPAHPLAQQLLQQFGGGVAAPSANKFTRISPTTASAVNEELGDAVDCIIDGGNCAIGLESTIIDCSHEQPRLLRPGMLTAAMIEAILGDKLLPASSAIRAPGMHAVHYAPRTKTRLISTAECHSLQAQASAPIALMTYSASQRASAHNMTVIAMPSEAQAYARLLYQILRRLDQGHYQEIYIEEVPESMEWAAIRDRIHKASARK